MLRSRPIIVFMEWYEKHSWNKKYESKCFNYGFFVGNRRISLTPIEWKMIILFMENPNRVISYEEIYDYVWGWGYLNKATVNTNINRLRNKIGKDKIDTVRGHGYI